MTERVLSQIRVAEMGFLERVHNMALRHKVRICETREALNVVPIL